MSLSNQSPKEENGVDPVETSSYVFKRSWWLLLPLAVGVAAFGSLVVDRSPPENFSRRLSEQGSVPSYMNSVIKDLHDRQKLFDETPPEEVKYWFEYTGPIQKYFYRFSKSRGKADYFEGRDDSGVVSARFLDKPGGTEEYQEFYNGTPHDDAAHRRLLENCLAMGHATRPKTGTGTIWNKWFGKADDRCRILFTINTVGAGRGTTMLWETMPPPAHVEGPQPWTSEQETAATHLERNLKEIDTMCASGLMAARVQMLVCEPIADKWTAWMDSLLPHCGGEVWPMDKKLDDTVVLEDRPSPLQVVVVGSVESAETCHDLKSGYMEQRVQDLILAPPHLKGGKSTHPDLISSEDHDLYVGMKWSSLVTTRAVHGFLQASADLAAAASSPANQSGKFENEVAEHPMSPFLIPSFVRVSYVSEENSKVAKWRMHGDFFHPAAWEICKESFDMTWIPHSLSGSGGVKGMCYEDVAASSPRRLKNDVGCGQWWAFFKEFQMPTSPEVYANENVPPVVQGGSNFIWMVTESQRQELLKGVTCRHEKKESCPKDPQAVIPLGDLESFLINYTPNTALGKRHVKHRRPGYTKEKEFEEQRALVKERKQLQDEEEIEKALFDYTIYPSALFHKDATLKAARARDATLTKHHDEDHVGPQTVKSSYYDVTITKPRGPVLGWCQRIARRGLCTLYADFFRAGDDTRCAEACGLRRDFTPISA